MNQKIKKIENLKEKNSKESHESMDISKILGKKTENMKYLDRKIQLVDDFGTMKAKKQASALKSNMINEENISSINAAKKILETSLKDIEGNLKENSDEQFRNKIENLQEILPLFDANETNIQNVFDINSSKYKIKI
jgi:hypothetical protein